MKKIYLLPLLGSLILFTLSMQSCSNEAEGLISSPSTATILKTPKMSAWSGSNEFGMFMSNKSRATDGKFYNLREIEESGDYSADENLNKYWDKRPNKSHDRDESVSQAEMDFVVEYIKQHFDEAQNSNQLSNYFIQNVGTTLGDEAREIIPEGSLWFSDMEIMSYSACEGDRGLCLDIPVNKDIKYYDADGKEIAFSYKFMKITLPEDRIYGENAGKTAIYLYMDFDGDGDYLDWIVKLLPGNMKPSNPSGSEDNSDNNEDNEGDEPGDEEIPTVPETDINEVEVNLSVNDEHDSYDIEDLVTKLSIHVKYPHDIRVTIPVPTRFVAEADDMAIIMSHNNLQEVFGTNHRAEYRIGDNLVELTVEYVIDGEMTNIVVTTKGINEEVIAYCKENFNDGINFEIWNYFAWNELDREGNWKRMADKIDVNELKQYLNQATIEFDVCDPKREECGDVCPDYYINAFGYDEDSTDINPRDCYVKPNAGQRHNYEDKVERSRHLNGTPYNDIYVKKGKNPEHAH